MRTVAIIAEYNPFHNGHLYQINTVRKELNADYCLSIMSGNFLQRGTPAMWDKYTRADMSLRGGIDLVFELPVVYSTGSAMDFAMGAVSILDKLNCIDYLCFGAETDDINLFEKLSLTIINEPADYVAFLKEELSSGKSFPAARAYALSAYFDNTEINKLLAQPNNILALEYITALKKRKSDIKPYIVKRNTAMYHDKELNQTISSATAIRNAIDNNNSLTNIDLSIPASSYEIIKNHYEVDSPIINNDLTPFIQYEILNLKTSNINYDATKAIYGINNELYNKINNNTICNTYEQFIDIFSSKNTTKATTTRALIHMLLNYKYSDHKLFIENDYAFYANILGFNRKSSALLKKIKENSQIPIVTKRADFSYVISNYNNISNEIAEKMHGFDLKATEIYKLMVFNKFNNVIPNDFTRQIVIL